MRLIKLWKVIYIARDINGAKSIEKLLREREIAVTLRRLEIAQDELDGNIEILVPQYEVEEAIHLVNEALLYQEELGEDLE